MPERWLLTGGTGQVGQALRRNPPSGVEIVAPSRDQLNLADLPPLAPVLTGIDAVINCGAYTAVDRAESEPEQAYAINATAPGRLASAALVAGIPIIHVSTDYVFPPDGVGPWSEDQTAAPGNVYGASKLAGENAVRASGARYAVIRTAWVISADGSNFVKTMLRLGAEREELQVVADQIGTPTHAGDLAGALGAIALRFTNDAAQHSGIWHCANAGETSWYELAEDVFTRAARRGMAVPRQVKPITTAEYPTPARRPSDSRLNCSKLTKDFGISLRPWQGAVEQIVAELASEGT